MFNDIFYILKLIITNNHKRYNINNIEESEKIFGLNHYVYQSNNDVNESLATLKMEYPNMVKNKEYFISLAQE